MALDVPIVAMGKLFEGRFCAHELADTVQSIPGVGTLLAAEFPAVVSGSWSWAWPYRSS